MSVPADNPGLPPTTPTPPSTTAQPAGPDAGWSRRVHRGRCRGDRGSARV